MIVTIRNSFKQLLRRPGKAILFFVLMTAATLLLVFGVAMYIETQLRMDALEDIYSTVGTVEQPWEEVRYESDANACFDYGPYPVTDYGEVLTPEILNFPGAEYLVPPESRPYYVTYNPELNDKNGNPFSSGWEEPSYDLLEFTPLETTTDGSKTRAKITKVIRSGGEHYVSSPSGWRQMVYPAVEEGQEFEVCQHQEKGSVPLEEGKKYVGYFGYIIGMPVLDDEAKADLDPDTTDIYITEYAPMALPTTSLVDKNGRPLESRIPHQKDEQPPRIIEADGDIDVGIWDRLSESRGYYDYTHGVLPITDPDLLASFRNNNVTIRGRMITEEEFETGAKVCLIDKNIADRNFLYDGKKIKLSLIASMYGLEEESGYLPASFPVMGSLLDGDGNILEPFWEEEYEIVGIYSTRTIAQDLPFQDTVIVPAKSIGASDEGHIIYCGPMKATTTSFMLKNGAQEEFAAALAEAAPQSERLTITYDDMGYAKAVESLDGNRDTAFLLLVVGLLAAAAIVVLLLYFFVIKEKKRTAIERSLGRSKNSCRASILAALMTLTFIAAGIGSLGACILLSSSEQLAEAQDLDEEDNGGDLAVVESESGYKSDWGLGGIYNFSGQFSPWAMWDIQGNKTELMGITVPIWVYVAAPLALWALVGVLALGLVDHNLKIEPILLLGTRA